jgi:hypothetical protein
MGALRSRNATASKYASDRGGEGVTRAKPIKQKNRVKQKKASNED